MAPIGKAEKAQLSIQKSNDNKDEADGTTRS